MKICELVSVFMRERRSLPISSEVALKSDKDGTGKLAVNSVLCGVVDELSNGRTGRRGSWVRHAVMGVLRWKDLTGVRTSTPTEQKEVSHTHEKSTKRIIKINLFHKNKTKTYGIVKKNT